MVLLALTVQARSSLLEWMRLMIGSMGIACSFGVAEALADQPTTPQLDHEAGEYAKVPARAPSVAGCPPDREVRSDTPDERQPNSKSNATPVVANALSTAKPALLAKGATLDSPSDTLRVRGPGKVRQTAAAGGEIVIGHVAGYTGPVAKDATDMRLGAQVMFGAVNARGGVLGRKVRLITADDRYNPTESVRLIRSLAGKVSALLPMTGSRNMAEVVKSGVLDKVVLPVVGAVPAQEAVRSNLHKNVFHFRAGDRDQLEKIVEQLTTVGIEQIAILTSDNPVGREAASIVAAALEKRALKLLVYAAYNLEAKNGLVTPIELLVEKTPQAVIIQGPPDVIANLTGELKKRGVTAMLYAPSYADFRLIAKTVGPRAARGFAISQVLPNVNSPVLPLVKAFRADFAKYGAVEEAPTFFNLEGYIAARLIVEAINNSRDPSPEGVIRGLEEMHNFDLGGYWVDFSPKKHNGSNWVDLSMIRGNGTLAY